MSGQVTRRGVLAGGVVVGSSVLGMPWSKVAHASKERLVVRTEGDIADLDPTTRVGPIDVNVLRAVAQGLVKFKPGSIEWEPDAAAEIKEVSPTLIEFTLKDGLTFTGGFGEVTADDVKFSFERFLPDASGAKVAYADDWATLKEVEVTGKLTGKIHLTGPSPAIWVIALADGSGAILSRKALEQQGGKVGTKLIGSGPYLLKEWVARDHFTLVANPDHHGEKPAFPEITGRPIGEQKTAELAFQTAELDFTRIDPVRGKAVAGFKDAKVVDLPAIDYVWIGPNVQKKPFDDPRVREGLRKAIDVEAILVGAYNGLAPRANALLAPGLVGHWDKAPVHQRDVEGAMKLLEEAGAVGMQTTLTILSQPDYQAAAAIVQANLAEVGIDLQVVALDSGAYWALGENDASANLDLSLIEYRGKFDPSFQTQWFTSDQVGKWNWQRWQNAEFDELHRKGASETDQAKRAEIYVRAQQLMDESMTFIWITHNVYSFAARSWLKPGILPNGNQWQYPDFRMA